MDRFPEETSADLARHYSRRRYGLEPETHLLDCSMCGTPSADLKFLICEVCRGNLEYLAAETDVADFNAEPERCPVRRTIILEAAGTLGEMRDLLAAHSKTACVFCGGRKAMGAEGAERAAA